MESRDEILKELKAIAPRLSALSKVQLYAAPDNYFMAFKQEILSKVKLSEVPQELNALAPELAKLNRLKQEAPTGYFTDFSSSLLSKIRSSDVAAELAAIAPVLNSIEKTDSIQVPAGYFAALPAQLQQLVQQQSRPQQAAMPAWMQQVNAALEGFISAVFKPRYSAAFAGIATSVVLAIMVATNITEQCKATDIDCQLAQLSATELNAYIGNMPDEFSKSVLDVSTDSKQLLNEQGTVSFDNYLKSAITDEDLDNAVL